MVITEKQAYGMYDEMLNECYGEIDICGLKYDAARALKEVDPTAYRCGFSDYMDSQGWDETEDGYTDKERNQ